MGLRPASGEALPRFPFPEFFLARFPPLIWKWDREGACIVVMAAHPLANVAGGRWATGTGEVVTRNQLLTGAQRRPGTVAARDNTMGGGRWGAASQLRRRAEPVPGRRAMEACREGRLLEGLVEA